MNISKLGSEESSTSISTVRSSSFPERSFWRNFSRVAYGAGCWWWHEQLQESVLGSFGRLVEHGRASLFSNHADSHLHEIAHHGLDVSTDVADLGEFTRFDLGKGSLGQAGQASRNLRLADTGRTDHEDVLRQDFLGHFRLELLATPAIAQCDGHGTLGVVLADDIFVELGNDLPGGEIVQAQSRA